MEQKPTDQVGHEDGRQRLAQVYMLLLREAQKKTADESRALKCMDSSAVDHSSATTPNHERSLS